MYKYYNTSNQKNQEKFLGYVDSTLSNEWNTVKGQEAVEELKPYRDNINRYIAWNDKLNKMVKNF